MSAHDKFMSAHIKMRGDWLFRNASGFSSTGCDRTTGGGERLPQASGLLPDPPRAPLERHWAARLNAALAACLPVRQANLKELGYGR